MMLYKRFNRRFRFYTFLLFIIYINSINLCFSAVVSPEKQPVVLDRYGKGLLLDISGQRVLLLSGSPYEMGFQQGRLLKTQVHKCVKMTLDIADLVKASDMKKIEKGLDNAFERTRDFIDKRFHDEMRGLADGAGIPLSDIQLANIYPELFHCSGFALFGNATINGKLFHGRILDYMTEVGFHEIPVVTVVQPKGYNSFITVGYAGFLGSVTGMNEKQVSIGEMGGAGEGDWDGVPMTFLVRKALEEADNLDEAVSIFGKSPRTCEYYYVISDGKIPDARGLYCTPEKFEVIEPNKSHPLLAHPIEDAVLMSSGNRYLNLVDLVKKQHGKIDISYSLDLMNLPVAMKSCLHRVLFEPEELNLWVSNAVDPEKDENYAACYQPYYKYNFNKLIDILKQNDANDSDADYKVNSIDTSSSIPAKKSADNTQEKLKEITGIVPETLTRNIASSSSLEQQELLNDYNVLPKAFSYQMKLLHENKLYQVYQISFPSPYTSSVDKNNTIYCEYYRCNLDGQRPAVIILDILDGSMIVSKMIASGLVGNGKDACIMTLPHYGSRRAKDGNLKLTSDLNTFVNSVKQAVMDVRRTARWLSSMDNIEKDQIGICGTSLGGFIAALATGVDGQFSHAAFILAGGNLSKVLTTGQPEVEFITRSIKENNISIEQLSKILKPIEPLSYADRIQDTKVLMINASEDKIVPANCARSLAKKAKTDINWYKTDHYGAAKFLFLIIDKLNKHF
jgi:isopenicillin-N N-acyltransferase like protein